MSGDRLLTEGDSTFPPYCSSSPLSGVPRQDGPLRPRVKQCGPRKYHDRRVDRSVSQRRRFSSTSGPNRRDRQIIVKSQPSGWYQVDHITRNLSLAPRLPNYESLMTYSLSGDHARRKRRARKNRHCSVKWPSNTRFPSPSVFGSTIGLLRELPCARLHYDSFRRIFPTLPTRTAKEKRFRAEAARQLPFAKYPDEQLQDVLDSTGKSITANVSQTVSLVKTNDDFAEKSQAWHTEGDTQVTNEVSEASTLDEAEEETKEEDKIPEEEEKNEEPTTENRAKEVPQLAIITQEDESITQEPSNTPHDKNLVGYKEEASIVKSDDFPPKFDTENKTTGHSETSYMDPSSLRPDEESLPYIDSEQGHRNVVPLAAYKDSTRLGDIHVLRVPPSARKSWKNAAERELSASGLDSIPMGELPPPGGFSRKSYKTKRPNDGLINLSGGKKVGLDDSTVAPTAPAAVSMFESVSTGRIKTGGLTCRTCSKAAYPAERLEADGKVFHVVCFRCAHCSTLLQRGAWNFRGHRYYCNPCHRRMALQTLRH